MNTLSIFMTPVARKFNLLRFFGNFFIKLRKEVKELNNIHNICSKDEFLSSTLRYSSVLMKVGVLFIAIAILFPLVLIEIFNNLVWFGQWLFILVAIDYFNACLETYDEEPKDDE